MQIEGEAKRVTIFIGESDRWNHKPLHTAIVELLREKGVAGATVVKGVEGFGRTAGFTRRASCGCPRIFRSC